ncbi:MAG TPA: hypothetical protein VFR23_04195 [Jiangellaceae bacterium]|nr:hypothetical protein [Jiangellaceae bacterium]
MADAWKYRWQVVRKFTSAESMGATMAICSHRWEWSAEWCSLIRRDTVAYYHDYRRTPEAVRPRG